MYIWKVLFVIVGLSLFGLVAVAQQDIDNENKGEELTYIYLMYANYVSLNRYV